MSKLPNPVTSVEAIVAKQEAVDTVSRLIERNLELEEIFAMLQPLLYELSVVLHGDDDKEIGLYDLINESIQYIKGERQ